MPAAPEGLDARAGAVVLEQGREVGDGPAGAGEGRVGDVLQRPLALRPCKACLEGGSGLTVLASVVVGITKLEGDVQVVRLEGSCAAEAPHSIPVLV